MIPVNQFILGSSDPLLYPSEKMTIREFLDARGGRGGRGGNIDNKVFESAITFWFKDVDFDGDKVWEYFHMNN